MKDLFSEFPASSADRWRKQIERDLKGEPFDSLLWENENGFTVNPFYTKEDLHHEYPPAFAHSTWRVATQVTDEGPAANKQLLRQLQHGADAVWTSVKSDAFGTTLKNVDLQAVSLSVECATAEAERLSGYLSSTAGGSTPVCFFHPALNSKKAMAEWISSCSRIERAAWLSIPAQQWSHAGALPVYEIALTLAMIVEFFDASGGKKINNVTIRSAVDCDLFVQVAKLRALRRLWELLKTELKTDSPLYIQCETALTNKSANDPYNNLIRTTVESTAAILGGCNELFVRPCDLFSPDPGETGIRLALNQQHVIREESGFDRVTDVSCGSFYIESLTDAVAEKALEEFKKIMDDGGYLASLEKGITQARLKTQAESRKQRIESLTELVIGVNKFAPPVKQAGHADLIKRIKKSGVEPIVAEYELSQSLRKA